MDFIERFSWPSPDPGQPKLPAVHGRVFAWLRKDGPRCWHGSPVFSPDGKRIAYVSTCGEPHGDIHLMDRDGGNDRRLTDTADYDRSPSFALDAKQIFFVRARRYGSRSPVARPGLRDWDIYWVDLTTGAVSALTNKRYYRADRPQMLPDGKRILAFLDPLYVDPAYSIWMIKLEKPEDQQPVIPNLTGIDGPEPGKIDYDNLYYPILSHDGTQLLFTRLGGRMHFTDMRTMATEKVDPLGIGVVPTDATTDFNRVLFLTQSEPSQGPKYPDYFSNLWLYRRDTGEVRRFYIDFSRVAPKEEPPATPASTGAAGAAGQRPKP